MHIVFVLKFVVEGTNNVIVATTGNTVAAYGAIGIHQLNFESVLDYEFLGELNGELLTSLHAIFGAPVPLNTKIIPHLQRGGLLVDSDVLNVDRLFFISMSRRDVHHSRGQYQQHGSYKRVNFKTYGFTHCILLIFLHLSRLRVTHLFFNENKEKTRQNEACSHR